MGTSSTQRTEIPQYIEDAGRLALQRAMQMQEMGYMPYMGPEVAAVNPYEQAMAANVGGMASAYGLQAPSSIDMGGMPTVSYGGMTGYTSYPAYIQNLQALQQARPDQYGELAGMTKYDPITGMVNPEFESNMPIFDTPVASNMPVYNNDRGDRTQAVMATPVPGSTRPRLRPEGNPSTWNSGGSTGLLSGIRSARDEIKNTVLDALGVV